ncbi:MAG TPA: glycoside hydrolase family 19 protein [Stellaceae bacterium]
MNAAEWADVLRQSAPDGKPWIIDGLAEAMPVLERDYGIDTVDRQAHFLAQIIHESDGLRTTQEYATGQDYEGRKALGNVERGDGVRYKGRGLIQLTGRANYRAAGDALGFDYLQEPLRVERFPHAALVSGWFWRTHALNRHADADDIEAITRAINGGLTHLERRVAVHETVRKALA